MGVIKTKHTNLLKGERMKDSYKELNTDVNFIKPKLELFMDTDFNTGTVVEHMKRMMDRVPLDKICIVGLEQNNEEVLEKLRGITIKSREFNIVNVGTRGHIDHGEQLNLLAHNHMKGVDLTLMGAPYMQGQVREGKSQMFAHMLKERDIKLKEHTFDIEAFGAFCDEWQFQGDLDYLKMREGIHEAQYHRLMHEMTKEEKKPVPLWERNQANKSFKNKRRGR